MNDFDYTYWRRKCAHALTAPDDARDKEELSEMMEELARTLLALSFQHAGTACNVCLGMQVTMQNQGDSCSLAMSRCRTCNGTGKR